MKEFTPEIECKVINKLDKIIEKTFVDAQRNAYEGLLKDIIEHDYTVSNILSIIKGHLTILDNMEKKNNE
jgi:hypothetical protein